MHMVSVADDMFPLKKYSVVVVPSPPWWDLEFTRVVGERRGAEILYFRNIFEENYINLSSIRDKSRRFFHRKSSSLLSLLVNPPLPGIDGIPYLFLANASNPTFSYYLNKDDSVMNTVTTFYLSRTTTIIYRYFIALLRSKRACESPEHRWPLPPMDTHGFVALPASWVGIKCIMEDGEGRWGG
ncbi:hypothetical protein EVAR_31351_1 [Eumeta japonica]|uniref:Uncharacterized protein n=1 Tax=Eumeta variegata TaxID=151549 RepID=A0A4C1XAI1_EUMVA|nr:hypothetical protein EVAR_31351_1 [Eumeta japonica]